MTPDVLVIGGGVTGLSAARACAGRGASVTLLADGEPSASAAAAGMLCPAFEALQTGGRALAAMGREALALWDGFAGALAGDPAEIGYERAGTLGVGYPPGALPGTPVAVPEGLAAEACVLVEGEGQVDPRLLTTALVRSCDALGVVRRRGRATALSREGDRVLGAALGDGARLRAGVTVLATGAGGLPGSAGMGPLLPVRGRAFLVRDVLGLDQVVRSPNVYLAPKPGGTLYVGATEEEEGAARDGPAAADGLWSEAAWLAPALMGAEVLARFDGLRARTPDELPVIGRARGTAGLVLALGHHRNGVLLAPLTAARVAEAALGG